jgi:hypothetical protein
MGIEGENMQAKGIGNIQQNHIQQNESRKLPKSQKRHPSRYRKPLGHQADTYKIEPLHSMLSLKELTQRPKKNIEVCKREKTK